MALTSRASPSVPTTTVASKKYDVFISFRGEDTRRDFTSHLHAALRRTKLQTYIDYRIEKGHEVWAELEKAIKDSSVFLVIFSENYASSTWCLNELLEIMDCKKNGEADVIPVFYKVDPSNVRKQSGSYRTALAKHKQSEERMLKWKDALSHAANLSGFVSREDRDEFDLIEDIIKTILQKLNLKYTNELRGHFIANENFSSIESLLRIDSKEVRIIGIWGMGGIGKTTLAAAVFHKFSSQYEGSCFLENVAEESQRYGLNKLCNRLLSKLLKEDLHIDTPKVIPSVAMRRLRQMKAFIVLDDVNTSELLENLVGVGHAWLGFGSRVIVTTRDKHVLSKGVDEIHEVSAMNFQNSLQLFCWNAFNETFPTQGYEEISKRAIIDAKGIPLALKVLGRFLYSKSKNEWDSALTKLKKFPNADIQKVLRLSYDGLDGDEKNIFLDIACFFKGKGRGGVTKLMNAFGFFGDIGIKNLLDKALITIDFHENQRIQMHDLIQEMGKQIICEESIGRRSRLWDPKDICDIFTNNKGTDAIECILLDMTQITNINLSSNAFKKMPSLRFLAFEAFDQDEETVNNSVYLPEGLESLPEKLIYFEWHGYPLKFLPSNFCPEKLVQLSLRGSNVEKLWHGVQNLPNLEHIDLEWCKHLIECPNLSGAPNLKRVLLCNCKSLRNVDTSIFALQKLEYLLMSGCTSLESLGGTICSPSLRGLFASDCFNLHEFCVPFKPSKTGSLFLNDFVLDLQCSGLSILPSSILQLRNICRFYFPICESMMDLPENFARCIGLSHSSKHEHDSFITLQKLLSTPGFRSLETLSFMSCHGLSGIPNNIGLLNSLQYLRLENCHGLSGLPNNISLLNSLHTLELKNCTILSLPESIKYLRNLKWLYLLECAMLQSILGLPHSIRTLFVRDCKSLQTVITPMKEPFKYGSCYFLLPNCMKLDEHSYDAILKDAILRIEYAAKSLSAMAFQSTFVSGQICYFLPARRDKFWDWFHYHSPQDLLIVELPPNVLGFSLCLVLAEGQSLNYGDIQSFRCECYLETSWGQTIHITNGKFDVCPLGIGSRIMSDHVFLLYDLKCCKQIIEAIKKRLHAISQSRSSFKVKIKLKFFCRGFMGEEFVISECGLRWICTSKRGGRSREIFELGSWSLDLMSLQQKKQKKDKQCVFGTRSNEMEDLRHLFEERLHI